jgi:hypothetical protein
MNCLWGYPQAGTFVAIGKVARLFSLSRPVKLNGVNTPQQLSREAMDEFKAIYEEEFGQNLSDDEVQEIAVRLLRFFGILAQPDKSDDQFSLSTSTR